MRPTCVVPDRRSTRRRRSDAGQASVEFALALPFVVLIALGVAQVGVAVRNELVVAHAAREGARAAAVSGAPAGAAVAAATRAVDLPVSVSTVDRGGVVTVTVSYVDPTDVAIIGRFLGPTTHRATTTMAVEPP